MSDHRPAPWKQGPNQPPKFAPLLAPVFLWSLFVKGRALWVAARRGERNWFIALLVLQTAGILETVYLRRRGEKLLPGR